MKSILISTIVALLLTSATTSAQPVKKVKNVKYNYNKNGSDWPALFQNCGGLQQSPIDMFENVDR